MSPNSIPVKTCASPAYARTGNWPGLAPMIIAAWGQGAVQDGEAAVDVRIRLSR